jgi:hypothetical protein
MTDTLHTLEALRGEGAQRMDPTSFHAMESLCQRIPQQNPAVQAILQARLRAALDSYQARLAQTHNAAQAVTQAQPEVPSTSPALQALRALTQELTQELFFARAGTASEPKLTADTQAHQPPEPTKQPQDGPTALGELKAVQKHRSTWSKMSTQKQVLQALALAPKNAGPINSHSLVLRSLALMRDISPDYLNRFVSYADTLLSLDQADTKGKASGSKTGTAKPNAAADRLKSRTRKILRS